MKFNFKIKRILLIVSVLVLLAVGVTSAWAYQQLRTPVAHNKQGQYIEIPRGSSPPSIVNRLTDEGIIKNKWPLMLYLKLTGSGSQLRAGEYNFPSPISPMAVIAKLRQGEQRLSRITIVEGWTRWDIANAMARLPEFGLTDSRQALVLMDDVSLISDLDPNARNLEGYLFPDTYEFPPNTKPEQLIEIMVKRFRKEWKPEWSVQAANLKHTPREIVTIASLIETEAKLREERPIISSVIYNRLNRDMALGVDSTIVYASKLEGRWRNDGKVYRSDVERRSPYNTRIYSGLPPGPIASPGKSSLEAALHPAQTNYLYYVREPSRNDGAHNFYDNERDFGQGVQALRNWEQQRDAEANGGK
ncbi:MAG TPA: endolytic transglycosylase MltG [Pyrinomonadaceae bacterium]|nr:endolytic transglycosylase MltG [Pyrinomonadaceae bacterium]